MNKHRGANVGESSGYGVKSRATPESMDCAQPLSSDPKVNHYNYTKKLKLKLALKAIDAVYFNSASKDGQYLVGATARRPNGVINGFLYIRVRKK